MRKKEKYEFMLIPKLKRDELEGIVQKFRDEFDNFRANDDIVQELDKIGFLVITANFADNLDGMILVDESSRRISGYYSNKIIFVNAERDLYTSRFILMHELAHYIEKRYEDKNKLESGKNGIWNSSRILLGARDHDVGYSNNPFEQEKDYMAAAILVPKNDFLQDINNYLDHIGKQKNKSTIISLMADSEFLHSIQWKYKVEEKLICRRIEEIAEDEAS